MDRASFYHRSAAFLVDLFVFAVLANAAAVVDFLLNQNTSYADFGAITAGGAWGTLMLLGILEATVGRTPGKWIAGLAIAMEDGRPATRRRLLARAAYKYAPVVLALFPILTYAWWANSFLTASYIRDGIEALFITNTVVASGVMVYIVVGCFGALKPDRQAAHDRAAGTAVFPARQLREVRGFLPVLPHEHADTATSQAGHSTI